MISLDFETTFRALTGNSPFPWQCALYDLLVKGGDAIPSSCNLPTGLGKTSVIPIWLIALAQKQAIGVPRRLVYVVNRRTVVDQATDEAMKLRKKLIDGPEFDDTLRPLRDTLENLCAVEKSPPLAISTLRGQYADNREWSRDPARPAVIVGTVDMIGSRLLFSGYGCGFKTRPLHAGFLGQDSLLVHDEAHLEPAFQSLLLDIENEQKRCNEFGKFRVMELSATARNEPPNRNSEPRPSGSASTDHADSADDQRNPIFTLTQREREPETPLPDPPTEPIHYVWRRLKAKKRLALHPVGEGKDAAAKRVAELAATFRDSNVAVLVFVRTLDDIRTVKKELASTHRPIVLLTGTIRGKERDELVKTPSFQRFLKGAPPGETVYLLCTSAGEVGLDISADHMVCDLSTFESMAQRLGRVHRYGEPLEHVARIQVVRPASFGKSEIEIRREKALELLQRLPRLDAQGEPDEATYDASPMALSDLRQRADLPCKVEDAFAPEPAIPSATDILFDNWAMTSIREPMPGRPEVAPYLHGIADDLPQTTIAWRAELDLLKNDPDPARKLKAIFAKHRIRPHESLTVNSGHLVTFLKEITAPKLRPDLRDARVALIFARALRLTTIGALLDDPGPLNAGPTLVLPASFGGLDDKGMLSVDAVPASQPVKAEPEGEDEKTESDSPPPSLDIADHAGYERYKDVPARLRVLIERNNGAWSARAMRRGETLPADWRLDREYETSARLVNDIRKQPPFRSVRLVQTLALDEERVPVRKIVCLSPALPRPPKKDQPLAEHVTAVDHAAKQLARALRLSEPFHSALLFAAAWHDEGKKAERWQQYIGGPGSDGQALGKSAEWRDPRLLASYRHEFGSLLRIPDDVARSYFADPHLGLTTGQQEQARELALHMIAAHHGYARPHFAKPLDQDFNTADREQTYLAVIRRYARLQRRHGRWGLAYLESLLRAADGDASRSIGLDPETDDDDAADTVGAAA